MIDNFHNCITAHFVIIIVQEYFYAPLLQLLLMQCVTTFVLVSNKQLRECIQEKRRVSA